MRLLLHWGGGLGSQPKDLGALPEYMTSHSDHKIDTIVVHPSAIMTDGLRAAQKAVQGKLMLDLGGLHDPDEIGSFLNCCQVSGVRQVAIGYLAALNIGYPQRYFNAMEVLVWNTGISQEATNRVLRLRSMGYPSTIIHPDFATIRQAAKWFGKPYEIYTFWSPRMTCPPLNSLSEIGALNGIVVQEAVPWTSTMTDLAAAIDKITVRFP